MDTVKAKAIKMIETLPDDCTWEDVRYRVYLRTEIELGLEDIRAGRVMSHEEVVREMEAWLASDGPAEPSSSIEAKSHTSEPTPAPAG
jgi:predicted transcriptional regulator